MAESKNVATEPKNEPLGGPKGLDSKDLPRDHQRTADVQDRQMRSNPPLSKEGDQWMKNKEENRKKEQEKLLKLQEKWNNRHKDNEKGENLSKEDMELFQRVAGARKRYIEIRDEVAGIQLDNENIEDYQDIRTQAYSEYVTLFEELTGQIKKEFTTNV